MENAKFILNAVREIVSPVYLVGGSVRDLILDQTPKDFDFATPLLPDDVEAKAKASGRHVYAIGKKFGTIGFKVADASGKFQYIEVTTFRREAYTSGNRKPTVDFVTDLQEDLSRRDFTMNAIAFDGNFIDPFGGRLDIMSRKIKAVGFGRARFREDPLRMLRAARFLSQLGFDIDPNLIGIIRKMPEAILDISRERWVMELDKLLVGKFPGYGLDLLHQSRLLPYILPEVALCRDDNFIWTRIIDDICDAPADPDIRWAKLLSRVSFPIFFDSDIMVERKSVRRINHISAEMARGIGLRLNFSNARLAILDETIKHHQERTQHA